MTKGASHSLRARFVSAIGLAAPAVAAIYVGPPYLQVLLAAAAIVLAWEWLHLCGDRRDAATSFIFATSLLSSVAFTYSGAFGNALLAIALGTALVYASARFWGRDRPGWIAAGIPYIGLPCLALARIWMSHGYGPATVLWIVAVVAATDIGAYFVGRRIGGPRLAPKISPQKTWAGLIGGMVCAVLVSVPAAILAEFTQIWPAAVAGLLLAIISQSGDLAESMVKRHFGVKDMSGIIPGHGGLFDRVDGLIAAVFVVGVAEWAVGGSVLAWQ
jgi:phosphatidate cytidylyltransferase